MRHIRLAVFAAFACLFISASLLRAEVKLPAIFADHMVLQQQLPVPVWGTADVDEKVTITFGEQAVAATADARGKWAVKLKPLAASERPGNLVVSGKNTITLSDVLVGEVWFCSGQSNMDLPVKSAANPDAEIAAANYPNLRLYTMEKTTAENPLPDVPGKWAACSPASAGDFSACAYYYGRELQAALKVPVGLIHGSWGGSKVEWWTSSATLAATPEAKPILDFWTQVMADWPQRKARFDKSLADWQKAADQAKKAGKLEPKKPTPGGYYPGSLFQPSSLYNGMISPLLPFAMRGVIWYQGESNRDWPLQYRTTFPAMIRDWRQSWGEGDFPFLYVQLPNFLPRQTDPGDSNLALLREAQLMTLEKVPNVAMAITIDIGDADNIHPKNKQEAGRRLALAGLALAYKQNVVDSGPLFQAMKVEGPAIRVTFKETAGGLVAKDGGVLKGFAIAGDDRHFVWADAKIDGDSVIVSSAAVAKPVAVRYAWADTPDCNLYNSAGLPAAPFRTDDWHSRPILKECKPDAKNAKQLRLVFSPAGEEGLTPGPFTGFLVAGDDKVFYPAQTLVYPNAVMVFSEQVSKPTAVRYAWPGSPVEGKGNVTALTGMALLPFHTDDWNDARYAK